MSTLLCRLCDRNDRARDRPAQIAGPVGCVRVGRVRRIDRRDTAANRHRRPPPPLLVRGRALDDRVDVAGSERTAAVLRSGDVRRRQLHKRVEVGRETNIRNGSVETGIFIRDVCRLSAQTNRVLGRRDRLERHTTSAVVLVMRRNE